MGVVGLFAWIGHANGGFLGGYLFDLSGGHAAAFGVAAVSAGFNLVVMGLLYRRTRGLAARPPWPERAAHLARLIRIEDRLGQRARGLGRLTRRGPSARLGG